MDANESIISPELQRLANEVKLMEAEMDAAHRGLEEFHQINMTGRDDMDMMTAGRSTLKRECDTSDVIDASFDIILNHPSNKCSSENKRDLSGINIGDSSSSNSSNDNVSVANEALQTEALQTSATAPTKLKFRTLALILTSVPRHIGVTLAIFFLSVIAQMYPTSPENGCYLSLLLFLFEIKSVSWQGGGKEHIVSLIVIVALTIVFDIDWLISSYFVQSLGEIDDFEFKLMQRTSFVWQMAWWAVASNVLLKIVATNHYLNVWSLLRGYFIPDRRHVPKSVSQKVIIVVWIDLLSSILLIMYFFLIQFDVVSGRMNVFTEAPVQLLSIQATLLFKITSGTISFLSLVNHIKIRDLCKQSSQSQREARKNNKKIVSSVKRSLSCLAATKGADFLFIVMLWISLGNALPNIQHESPKDIKIILILITVTNSLTSFTPLLVGSIFRSIRLSVTFREESRREAMDQNSSHRSSRRTSNNRGIQSADRRSIESPDTNHNIDYDYDFASPSPNVRNSQSLFSTRLDAASPTPRASSLHLSKQNTSFELDLSLHFTPQEFESEWQSLSIFSRVKEHPISCIPSLAECNVHFNRVGWFIIASGVVNTITKMFLVAQRDMKLQEGASSSRCLVQLSLFEDDCTTSSMMTIDVRCQNEDDIDSFITSLELIDLFDLA